VRGGREKKNKEGASDDDDDDDAENGLTSRWTPLVLYHRKNPNLPPPTSKEN